MLRYLSDVGFKFGKDDYEDGLMELFGGLLGESGREIEWGDRRFLYIYADKDVEFWFPIDSDGSIDPTSFEMHYNTNRWIDLSGPEWVKTDESGIGGILCLWDYNAIYPMNICVPNAFCVAELTEEKYYKCQIACFAESIEIYKSEEEFSSNFGNLNMQAFIPLGQFATEEQSSHAHICGIVKEVQKKTNSVTGNDYYHLLIDTHYNDFDVFVDEELVDSIEIGDIVSVIAFMTGKIRPAYEGIELANKERIGAEKKELKTLDDLYCILTKAWCRETAYPKCQLDWDGRDPSYGQSDVTAMLVYTMFGGTIHKVSVNGELHYFNRIDDVYVDLTREHFDLCNIPFMYEPNLIYSRQNRGRLDGLGKRFELLIKRVTDLMKNKKMK